MISITANHTGSELAQSYDQLSDLLAALPGVVYGINAGVDYDIDNDGVDGRNHWLGADAWDAYHGKETSSTLLNVEDALDAADNLERDMAAHKMLRRIWCIEADDLTLDAAVASTKYVDFVVDGYGCYRYRNEHGFWVKPVLDGIYPTLAEAIAERDDRRRHEIEDYLDADCERAHAEAEAAAQHTVEEIA